MRIQKFTLFLAILVFATIGVSFAHRSISPVVSQNPTEALRQLQEKKQHFPTAEYNEPDLADSKRNLLRKEKQLRKNDFKVVAKNPPTLAS